MSASFDQIVAVAALAAAVAAVPIPVLLWWADRRSGQRLSRLQELQVEILTSQERLGRQRRRDSILDRAASTENAALLRILWAEVDQFDGDDRRLLQATFRNNSAVELPGAYGGADLPDILDAEAFHDYVQSLQARYSSGGYGFDGLLPFLEKTRHGQAQLSAVDLTLLAAVLTGGCAVVQRPDDEWYLNVVKAVPAVAPHLLTRIADISAGAGPLRMNALAGTLEGILAVRHRDEVQITHGELHALRYEVMNSLVLALRYGPTKLVVPMCWGQAGTAADTVAKLIDVAGWVAGMYGYLGGEVMRLLPHVIHSIPEYERSWGANASQVRRGFTAMEETCPAQWSVHRAQLETAADCVGPWRDLTDGSAPAQS